MTVQDASRCGWAHRPQVVCQGIAIVSCASTVLVAAEAAWEAIKGLESTHRSVVHLTTVKCGATRTRDSKQERRIPSQILAFCIHLATVEIRDILPPCPLRELLRQRKT